MVLIYFVKKRTLAIGISSTGSSIGMIVTAPYLGYIADHHGVNNAFIAMIIMTIFCMLLAYSYRPLKREIIIQNKEIENKTTEQKKQDDVNYCSQLRELFTDKVFIMFLMALFIQQPGFYAPPVYMVDRATAKNPDTAKYLLSSLGVGSTIGRVVFGYLGDLSWLDRAILLVVATLASGIATVVSGYLTNYWHYFAYMFINGFFTGGIISINGVLVLDVCKISHIETAYGLMALIVGFGTAFGIPILGICLN